MAAERVEVRGLSLAVHRRGAGAPVVLVHGTGLGAGLWQETVEALGPEVETIAYDRRGYGRSEAPEPYGGTTVEEQAEEAAALIEALGAAPVVVCGHELGALVALDLLRRHASLVRAVVAIEPPALWLSGRGPEAVSRLRAAIETGVREQGPEGAVEAYLAAVGTPAALERLGPERLREAQQAARALAVDLGAGPSWSVRRSELRALGAPVTVIAGRRSVPERREAAAGLAELIPGATLEETDAGHLVPLEAATAVAAAVRGLLAS